MTVPTDTSVTLYKEGVASPPLHPIDVSAWRSLGWTEENEEIAKLEVQIPSVSSEDVEEKAVETPPPTENLVQRRTRKAET